MTSPVIKSKSMKKPTSWSKCEDRDSNPDGGKRLHAYSLHAYRRVYHSATLAYPRPISGDSKTQHAMKTEFIDNAPGYRPTP
jgi:hypothetical protein